MAHVRSLSQQLSDLESLNTALEEHTKAIQAAAVASTAGVVGLAKAKHRGERERRGGREADRDP